MAKFLKHWLPVILWAGLIFYLSSRPGLNSGLAVFWDVFLRKLAHAGEFGILNLLIFRALRIHDSNVKKALGVAFLLAVLYAFSDEAHQSLVPLREAKLSDVGIDSLGILAAGLVLFCSQNLRRRQAIG